MSTSAIRLIHWIGAKCARKDCKVDERRDGNVTFSAIAGHIGNVTCPSCRSQYYRPDLYRGKP